jgi:hypothetical protein
MRCVRAVVTRTLRKRYLTAKHTLSCYEPHQRKTEKEKTVTLFTLFLKDRDFTALLQRQYRKCSSAVKEKGFPILISETLFFKRVIEDSNPRPFGP